MADFLKYCCGYVIIFAKGPYMERFFRQCAKRGLLLWNVEANNDGYTFMVSKKSFGIVMDLAKATGSHLSILKRIGLPFLLHQYRKRKLFILGCIIAFCGLYLCSLFLWDISIEGTDTYTDQEVLAYVTTHCAYAGEPLNRIDCISIEEQLRNHFPKTAWVSCELKGTQLLIHMKEIIPLKEYHKEETPSDLVAAKEGTITKIAMREGTVCARVGQYVKANDLLVSGTIEYHDDAGEIVKNKQLAADADIIAKTQYDYEDTLEYVRYEKTYRKGNRYKGYLHIGKKTICWLPTFHSSGKSQKEYDQDAKYYKMKLGKTFYFPIQIEWVTLKPYTLKRVEYSKKQLCAKARKRLQSYCNNLSQKGVEITGNNVTIKDVNGKLVASGSIFTLEPIAKRRLIHKNEQKDKKDKNDKENMNERSGETTERSQ